jgi:hypothetical protein
MPQVERRWRAEYDGDCFGGRGAVGYLYAEGGVVVESCSVDCPLVGNTVNWPFCHGLPNRRSYDC